MSHFNLVDFIPLQSSYSGVINYGIRFLFLLTVTVIIATVFYRLVEVPFQQLGKKLINRLDNNKQPVDGVGSARA
jgi:peptidoglycan/LPS O-acetylase OafA/YrhL